MEFIAISLIFMILFGFLFFAYGALSLRRRILSYLRSNYTDTYKEIAPNYSVRDILSGGPEILVNLLRQDKRLLSKQIRYDKEIGSLQRKYIRKILVTLMLTIIYLIYLLLGVRFLLE